VIQYVEEVFDNGRLPLNPDGSPVAAGNTALLIATRNRQAGFAKRLLGRSSNVDKYCTDAEGNTPLHIAAQNNDPDTIAVLAQVPRSSIKNHDGKVPTDYMHGEGYSRYLECVRAYDAGQEEARIRNEAWEKEREEERIRQISIFDSCAAKCGGHGCKFC
jgi:ankyrin repeat protein